MIPPKTELCSLYIDQKLTQKDISDKYHVSKATVCRWFKQYGIDVNYDFRTKEPLSKENLLDLYVNQGLSTEEISKKCGVHRVTVAKWLKTSGIPRVDVTKPKDIPPKETLENLYLAQFKTLDEIGSLYNVNRNLVSKWLSGYDIKIRLFGIKIEMPTKEILERLYIKENLTIEKIATFYQTNSSVVRRWLVNCQIDTRSNQRKFYHLKAVRLTDVQRQFLIGTMLGDGHLACVGKKQSVRLSICHSIKQADYFFWKKELMQPYINNVNVYKETKRNSVRLSSASIFHNEFVFFHKLFYDNRKKVIRQELMSYLTPFAMAIWVMDDGWKLHNCNIRISSESFTKEENETLQNIIKMKFGINCKVNEYSKNNKKYYYLSFNKRNSILLTRLIEPYMRDSLKYKLIRSSTTDVQSSPTGDEDTV